jgi:hypothetical protein
MAETGKGDNTPPGQGTPLPAALFKNSLLLWQARWKARQAAPGAEADGAGKPSRARRPRKAPPAE